MMVDQYSWRLYLNNLHGTTWAPRYLPNTLKLALKGEEDTATKTIHPIFTATARFQQTGAPLTGDATKVPVWMRLAVHKSDGAVLTEEEWRKGNGAGGTTYPLYQEGVCVKDSTFGSDGVCTVTFQLSNTWPAGEYYVAMMNLEVSGVCSCVRF